MPKKKIVRKEVNDKFYTAPAVAVNLFKTFEDVLNRHDIKYTFKIEPSAGNGSFSNQFTDKDIAFDLIPEGQNILQRNWFSVSHIDIGKDPFVVIGNPPFGERNTLTKAFIKHALSFDNCSAIGFVLPEVFCKRTMQKVFPPSWKLLHEEPLPENSFLLRGIPYHVPCVFQIWTPADTKTNLRKQEICLDNPYFSFVKSSADADLFIFGAAPHRTIPPAEVAQNNRGYYVRCKKEVDTVKEVLENVDWKSRGKSSVSGGAFWVTKEEIIEILTER